MRSTQKFLLVYAFTYKLQFFNRRREKNTVTVLRRIHHRKVIFLGMYIGRRNELEKKFMNLGNAFWMYGINTRKED